MDDRLTVLQNVYDDIIAHARSLTPIESCGYLAGKGQQIDHLYKMTNIDNEPDHFSFEPKEQFAVVKDARKNGWDLLAVYHSHPESPARPSKEDLNLLKDPNMIYVIVSLMADTPDIKAFRLHDNNISSVTIEIQ